MNLNFFVSLILLLTVGLIISACSQTAPIDPQSVATSGNNLPADTQGTQPPLAPEQQTPPSPPVENTPNVPAPETTVSGVSSLDFSKHNSETDCWVIYKGKVYDVTAFLPKHKGGVDKIARFCGVEGFEQAFIKQHGSSKVDLFMKVAQVKGELI